MDDTDTRSVSSWESFYSVESSTSEEEEEEKESEDEQLLSSRENLRIFLLGDGREARLPRDRRLRGPGFLLLPGLDPGRCARRPLGSQPAGCGRCRGLEGPGEALRGCRSGPNGSLPGQRAKRKGAEGGGSCAMVGSRPPPCSVVPGPTPGTKRQRRKEVEVEETLRPPCWTDGDQAFARKCWELQGFVRPLSELLNRLKMGCFDRGLSTFQQSLAMDRMQRIIGVLQKPQMGERYLGTLLQVEKMLRVWFPHIPLKDSQASCSGSAREAPGAAKFRRVEDQIVGSTRGFIPGDVQRPLSDLSTLQDCDVGTRRGEPVPTGNGPATNLTWIHTWPTVNPLLEQADFSQVNSALGQILLGPNTSSCGLVFFLQKVVSAQATSRTLAHGWPPSIQLPGPGEILRPQSLPGVLPAGSSAPRGTLGDLSLSLPHLSMSGEELQGSEASIGKPVKCLSF